MIEISSRGQSPRLQHQQRLLKPFTSIRQVSFDSLPSDDDDTSSTSSTPPPVRRRRPENLQDDQPQQQRRVRFANDDSNVHIDPDFVTTQTFYVDQITDPVERARMHSSAAERKLYKANAKQAIRQAAKESANLILEMNHLFFGTPPRHQRGNSERMLQILLTWLEESGHGSIDDEYHRGLETILLQRSCRASSTAQAAQWALFLAVADSVVVHGPQKILQDAALRDRTTTKNNSHATTAGGGSAVRRAESSPCRA